MWFSTVLMGAQVWIEFLMVLLAFLVKRTFFPGLRKTTVTSEPSHWGTLMIRKWRKKCVSPMRTPRSDKKTNEHHSQWAALKSVKKELMQSLLHALLAKMARKYYQDSRSFHRHTALAGNSDRQQRYVCAERKRPQQLSVCSSENGSCVSSLY